MGYSRNTPPPSPRMLEIQVGRVQEGLEIQMGEGTD